MYINYVNVLFSFCIRAIHEFVIVSLFIFFDKKSPVQLRDTGLGSQSTMDWGNDTLATKAISYSL